MNILSIGDDVVLLTDDKHPKRFPRYKEHQVSLIRILSVNG